MENEEKIKSSERILFKLVNACDTLINRHEHSGDPDKVKKYMKYLELQKVNNILSTFSS